jgi:hypothetical protein
MSCCCVKTLNLCNVPVCGVLEIDVNVESPGGEYTLKLDFLNTILSIAQEQDTESIRFDVSALNENFQYTGQIIDPSGEVVSITSNDETYDCIKFKTVLNVASY